MTGAEQIRQEERERQERRFKEILEERNRILLGARRDLYAALEDRNLPGSDLVRARIDACDDVTQLTAWLRRAATADSAAAVLESPE